MIRKRVLVSGLVQGVWFRDGCRTEAVRLGVTGCVRNLPDLRVEAVFEGEPDAVGAMVEWCVDGPPGADVRGVETFDEQPTGASSFDVEW